MYSHLSQAVAQEQLVDRLEFAVADRRSAELLRQADDIFRPAPATVTSGRSARVPLSGHVTRRESSCVEA